MVTSVWLLVFTFSFPAGQFGGGMLGDPYPSEATCKADHQVKVKTIMDDFQFEPDNFPTLALHCVQQPLAADTPAS